MRELLLHDRLGCDARVVGAQDPERVAPAHPVEADQRVLDRPVERVAHVQRAGDVGRRDRDRVVLRRGALGRRVEVAALHPAPRGRAPRPAPGRSAWSPRVACGARRPCADYSGSRWPTASGFGSGTVRARLERSSTPGIVAARHTSSRSSSISTQTPARRGQDDVIPSAARHVNPGALPPVEAGADGQHDALLDGGSSMPCGTTSPDRRIRSWSSSLMRVK